MNYFLSSLRQLLWNGGIGAQMYAVRAGQILIAQQRGWKTDDVLAFLLDQRKLVQRVEWAGHKMDMEETERYVIQRRTMNLEEATAHVRQRKKRGVVRQKVRERKLAPRKERKRAAAMKARSTASP
jgi:hypothetical protein